MKKHSFYQYFALGIQFTSMLVVPPLVIIFGGMYLQDKYGLGDSFVGWCVAAAALIMPLSLYGFAKTAWDISKKDRQAEKEDEGNGGSGKE